MRKILFAWRHVFWGQHSCWNNWGKKMIRDAPLYTVKRLIKDFIGWSKL